MSDFVPTTTTEQENRIDPNKHVRYSYGMVLGKDDLEQEFAFHHGRDLWGMRQVIGYGVVRGLDVRVEDDGANGPRISVLPGVAVTPRGELVCVPSEQCASLNAWLQKQTDDPVKRALLEAKINSNRVTLYVTLCYRECPTDDLPIPGEPCRDQADAMAPSRIADDFSLELRLAPPDQLEEASVRDVVVWVRKIPLSPAEPLDAAAALANFETEVRKAFFADRTKTPPEIGFHDPPASLTIPTSHATEFFRAALRVWVTDIRPRQDGLAQYVRAIRQALEKKAANEQDAVLPTSEKPGEARFINAIKRAAGLSRDHTTPGLMDADEFAGLLFSKRPELESKYWDDAWSVWDEALARWMARGAMCAWQPEEECALLGSADVPLKPADANNKRIVNGNAVDVPLDHSTRPFVAHLRMLQEWLLSDVHLPPPIVLAGDVVDAPGANKVVRIQTIPVSPTAPTLNQILQYDGAMWIPAPPPAGSGAPVTLAGDVAGSLGTNQIRQLQGKDVDAATPGTSQVLQFNGTRWVAATLPTPPAVTLGGDVSGNPGVNQLARIQGKPVNAAAPGTNQVLQFNGTSWVPATITSSPAVDVIRKPKGLPDYFIVAAGRVRGDGFQHGPVFNDLTMAVTGQPGVVILKFNGYKEPDDSFQYIVKAIGCFPKVVDLTIVFMDFTAEGILMGATVDGKPVDTLQTLELMVEISQYLK